MIKSKFKKRIRKKNIIIIITIVAIVFCMFHIGITPKNELYFKWDKYYYCIDGDQEVTLMKKHKDVEALSVTIPSNILFFPVKKIGDFKVKTIAGSVSRGLFQNNKYIKEVYISEGIEEIGENAFSYSTLKIITIPSTIRIIGWKAFYQCRTLSKVVFQEGLNAIISVEDNAETVQAENTVRVAAEAFQGCDYIEQIIIPSSVQYISDDIFEMNSDLKIYGVEGSYAEEYANKMEIPFEEINSP